MCPSNRQSNVDPQNAALASRILRLRTDTKLSQDVFAARLGFSLHDLQAFEKGERAIPCDVIWAAAKQFDADPLWLLYGESNFAQSANDYKLLAKIGAHVEETYEALGVAPSRDYKWQVIALTIQTSLRDSAFHKPFLEMLASSADERDDAQGRSCP